jgi:hypothetical protein
MVQAVAVTMIEYWILSQTTRMLWRVKPAFIRVKVTCNKPLDAYLE